MKRFETECIERKLVKDIIGCIDKEKYFGDNIYYEKVKEYFELKDYFVVAMCLMPLLESIVNKLLIGNGKKIKNNEKYCKKYFYQTYHGIFNNRIKDRFSKNLLILNIFPSLRSYMRLIFCTSKKEWDGELNVLKRDLVFHGKNSYIIHEVDCIRLFNAVFVAYYVLDLFEKFGINIK